MSYYANNRLIAVLPPVPQAGDSKVAFSYDHMNRRVRMRVYGWSGSNWSATPSRDLKFVYDGWNVVQVLDGLNSDAVLRQYAWGLDLSGSMHGAGGIGGLLSVLETLGTTGGSDDLAYWFTYDGNGNVSELLDATDPADPILAGHYEYDAFGRAVVTADRNNSDYVNTNPFRFSTKWFDGLTGLGYWGHRYYSPSLGRWISRDPIGEERGISLYAYSNNTPISLTDYLGLCTINGPHIDAISWIEAINNNPDRIMNKSSNPAPPVEFSSSGEGTYAGIRPSTIGAWKGNKEYRNHHYIRACIECDKLYGKINKVNWSIVTQDVGYTPIRNRALWTLYGQYHKGTSGPHTLTESIDDNKRCYRIDSLVRFRVHWWLNYPQSAISGNLMPYAWSRIVYVICCDGSTTIRMGGSYIPSHSLYINYKRASTVSMGSHGDFTKIYNDFMATPIDDDAPGFDKTGQPIGGGFDGARPYD